VAAAPPAAGHTGAGSPGMTPAQGARVEAVLGDITAQQVDAIVNAAKSSLLGGGGVDGAIHRAAGPRLLEECRRVRATTWPDGLPVGEAVATGAGDLPARFVVHTVGPNRHAGQTDPALLGSCFRRSLVVAAEVGAGSVAFPAVSAGIYGWDVVEVASVAVSTVREVLDAGQAPGVRLVRFVLFDSRAHRAFADALTAPPP
jgi:O-acetyl-ADP-ribose deacetylase